MRQQTLQVLRDHYIPERIQHVDVDFLSFEEDLTTQEDLERVVAAGKNGVHFTRNPHNSIILYVTGLTDQFDSEKARADTRGGSPPDIDIDFEALGRDKAVDWVIEEWGREHVANIITHGTFKPKSLTRRYFKLTEENPFVMGEVLKCIPPPVYGKEAKLAKVLEQHPELTTEERFSGWLKFATHLEGMVANFGIHAAGIVISGHPIPDTIPCWKNSKSEFITQYDMHEVEELGSIKFDFLVINNLDILKECVRLIKERHGKEYDIYDVPDGNEKAYELMHQGLLTGVFQMETSGSAKKLIQRIKPTNLEELSDINALNRPGPMEAGLDEAYIINKANGYAPSDMPSALAEILRGTYWTLVYQEQIMRLVSDLAGFTLQEADDVRRAMGKKKVEVLDKYRIPFIQGCVDHDIDKQYAETLWDDTLIGFANYCFNKSHSIAYSVITYLCAYFKANYPVEFFTALMTIRSQVMQPKLWAQKAPEFVQEAKHMGITINAPSIQASELGFTIQNDDIYFGLNAIKGVGVTACRSIIAARRGGKFKDIWNFLARVNRRKITTRTFGALVYAGAFDRMGYTRAELLEKTGEVYKYFSDKLEYEERIQDKAIRDSENAKKDKRRAQLDEELKEAKALIKILKKAKQPIPVSLQAVTERPARLREYRKRVSELASHPEHDVEDVLSSDELTEYNESLWLRKKPALKLKEEPVQPELSREKRVKVSVKELMEQAEHIGCYLQQHPARVLFPDSTPVANADLGDYLSMGGQVTNYKQIKTKRGQDMAFVEFGDGSGIAEGVIFPKTWAQLNSRGKLPAQGDIVLIQGKVEGVTDTQVKVIVNRLDIYRPKE
jgi:DNA-directed DNA polymerase III PolC